VRFRTERLFRDPHAYRQRAVLKPFRVVLCATFIRRGVMNKNQVKGRVKEAKGKGKEVAGKLSGNKKLEQEGKLEKVGGKVEKSYGDLKRDIKKSTK
jgi:uncharacterized protein YjbJ (UPF0337 family)